MAIFKKEEVKIGRELIDLNGPQGNAYYLLARAKHYCNQLEMDYEVIGKEMKSSDYDHLIKIFDKCFGEYVDLLK